MKYDPKEFAKYPDIMNKEQMRMVCHISKRTALYLLQSGLIPSETTGKKTRCYLIKKSDVIAFYLDHARNPERYLVPKGWYQYSESVKLGFQITLGRQRCVAKASNFPKNVTNSEKRRKKRHGRKYCVGDFRQRSRTAL